MFPWIIIGYFLHHIFYILNKEQLVRVFWFVVLGQEAKPFWKCESVKCWLEDIQLSEAAHELRLQAWPPFSGMFVILLKCCDDIAQCVAQPHLRPAVLSLQPEITTSVCSWRVCSQGDFASWRRGLGVNTQRRSGRLPSVIRQAFHRALWYVFFLFSSSSSSSCGFPLENVQGLPKFKSLVQVQLLHKCWAGRKWPIVPGSSQLSTYRLWWAGEDSFK